MLLEDDWVLSHTISKVLSVRDYTCVSPRTVEDIFYLLNNGEVALVVSDLNLPWINTLELCKLIKHSKKFRHIPFIFISGSCEDQKIKETFQYGCDDFLNKPFHIQELSSAIEILLHTPNTRSKHP